MTAKMLVMALAAVLVVGGVAGAMADDGPDDLGSLEAIDIRKDDATADVDTVDEEPDDDPTGGGDGARVGDGGAGGGDGPAANSGDGDNTAGDDGTSDGHNNDGDDTAGNDGSSGGNNSEVAVAPAAEPTPAPVYYDDGYSDDGYSDDGYSD